tara:strand:- start:377 stop:667 length:291 start_codon:yes stop_codon:yes gene_type:complete
MFTQLLNLMATLKPRPVYKKTVTKKTMTEQTKPPLQTLTKVQSHLDDIQLIERNALWEDFKNRMKINNYEVKAAMSDLKQVVHKTKELYSKVRNNV